MSTRRGLNLTLAAAGLLLLAAGGFVGSPAGTGRRRGRSTRGGGAPADAGRRARRADRFAGDTASAATRRWPRARPWGARSSVSTRASAPCWSAARCRSTTAAPGASRKVGDADGAAGARAGLPGVDRDRHAAGRPGRGPVFGRTAPRARRPSPACRPTIADLTQHLVDAADGIRRGAAQRAELAGVRRLGRRRPGRGVVSALVVARVAARPQAGPRARRTAARRRARTGTARATNVATPATSLRPTRARASPGRTAPYAPTIDFDNVNAAVDQMSVDMNTIAGSTDKMRQAIDSVGFALQGMLYSLNEMAQDTAEGHKIVRNANNAAAFTADASTELVDSAREMSRIVGRVTQLAQRTRQVAAANRGRGHPHRPHRRGLHIGRRAGGQGPGAADQPRHVRDRPDRERRAGHRAPVRRGHRPDHQERRGHQQGVAEPRPVDARSAAPRAVRRARRRRWRRRLAGAVPARSAPRRLRGSGRRSQDDPVAPVPTPLEVDPHATAEAIRAPRPDAAGAGTGARTGARTRSGRRHRRRRAPAAADPAATARPDGGSNGNVFMLGKPRRKPSVAEVLGTEPRPEAAPAEALPAVAAAAAPRRHRRAPRAQRPPARADACRPAAPGGRRQQPQRVPAEQAEGRPSRRRPAATAAPRRLPPTPPGPGARAGAAPAAEARVPSRRRAPTGSNIFMLNRPKAKTAPAERGRRPAAAAVGRDRRPPRQPRRDRGGANRRRRTSSCLNKPK